jgi:hypothetical protein
MNTKRVCESVRGRERKIERVCKSEGEGDRDGW